MDLKKKGEMVLMNNIAYVCWQIWKMGCEMVMERKCIGVNEALRRVNMAVNEFYFMKVDLKINNKESGMVNKKKMEKWKKSEEGWMKVNCDGALDLKTKVVGSGIIVRNSDGIVVDGVGKRRMADNALMAEALALKDGIGLVIERNGKR